MHRHRQRELGPVSPHHDLHAISRPAEVNQVHEEQALLLGVGLGLGLGLEVRVRVRVRVRGEWHEGVARVHKVGLRG